jgi:hypothetical protein
MKKIIIIGGVIVLAVALLAPTIVQAQGMTYLSNLGQPSAGSEAVGSDSWLAEAFQTGTNISGYSLNSVQLDMTDASGNPGGFTVMIYSNGGAPEGISPGSSLGILVGSANPTTSGIYTYTPAANFTLSPITDYFIVLTAGTVVANGDYKWSYAGTYSYNPSDKWATVGGYSIAFYHSSDGLAWTGNLGTYPQFALNATPIPEPSSLALIFLSGGVLIYARRKSIR